jgi:hypothetical protein
VTPRYIVRRTPWWDYSPRKWKVWDTLFESIYAQCETEQEAKHAVAGLATLDALVQVFRERTAP